MFSNPTTGFVPREGASSRWIDLEKLTRIEKERAQYESTKLQIEHDFKEIQKKLKKVLDENEDVSEEEQLPLQSFNLDDETTENTLDTGKRLQEKENEKMLKVF